MSNSKLGERLFTDTVHCDIVFVVEKEEIPCHRLVFATSCAYFDKLLNGDFRESKTDEVTITQTSAKVFKEVKRYIYLGQLVTADWTIQDLLGLLSKAHEYQHPELLAEVMNVLVKQSLDFDSWTLVNSAAATYDSGSLRAKCVTFAEAELDNFLCNKNMEKMTDEFICFMFNTPKISTVNQDQLLSSLLQWKKTHSSAEIMSVFQKICWSKVSHNITASIAKLFFTTLEDGVKVPLWNQLVASIQAQSKCIAKLDNILLFSGPFVGIALEKQDCRILCNNYPGFLEFSFVKNGAAVEIPVKRIEFELSNQYHIRKVGGTGIDNRYKGMDYKIPVASNNWLAYSATYSYAEGLCKIQIFSSNFNGASEITLRRLEIY